MTDISPKDMLEGVRGSPVQMDGLQGTNTRRLKKSEGKVEFSPFILKCARQRGQTIIDLRLQASESRAWIAKFQAAVKADLIARGKIPAEAPTPF